MVPQVILKAEAELIRMPSQVALAKRLNSIKLPATNRRKTAEEKSSMNGEDIEKEGRS